jgi:hypothetical protein
MYTSKSLVAPTYSTKFLVAPVKKKSNIFNVVIHKVNKILFSLLFLSMFHCSQFGCLVIVQLQNRE